MSDLRLRTPLAVGARLWLSLVGVEVLLAAVLCLGARAVFVEDALARLTVCGRVLLLLAASATVLTLAVAETTRRMAPLYRAARRTQRDDDVPPSQSALRDANAAPLWLGAVVAGPGVLAGVGEAASGGAVFDAPASAEGLPFALFVASAASCFAVLAVALTQRAVEGWLVAFRPDQQVIHHQGVSPPALETLATVPVASLAGAVVAVVWAASPGPSAVAAAVLAAAAVAGTWSLARRARARLAADELTLATRLHDATEALGQGPPRAIDLAQSTWQTAELAELAAEIDRLAVRYAALAREEDLARASVQELQRSKMLFMASMSHDLRSPLNSILGFGELLQQSGQRTFNDAQRESVRLIARSGEELLRLLNDVLDSARYEAGRLQLRRSWTPSVEILTEAVRQAREVVEDDQLEIVAELQPGLPPVYVDRERIVQAVLGLFRHAARAMSGGTIRMYARVAPDPVTGTDQLRVDVVDRSGGIRDEDRERIFEAFREVTSVSGRRIGGLGLTLSLARALVRAHAGEVWIDNEPGRGTTFTVAIPLASPSEG